MECTCVRNVTSADADDDYDDNDQINQSINQSIDRSIDRSVIYLVCDQTLSGRQFCVPQVSNYKYNENKL